MALVMWDLPCAAGPPAHLFGAAWALPQRAAALHSATAAPQSFRTFARWRASSVRRCAWPGVLPVQPGAVPVPDVSPSGLSALSAAGVPMLCLRQTLFQRTQKRGALACAARRAALTWRRAALCSSMAAAPAVPRPVLALNFQAQARASAGENQWLPVVCLSAVQPAPAWGWCWWRGRAPWCRRFRRN